MEMTFTDRIFMMTPWFVLAFALLYPKYKLVREILLHVDEKESLNWYEHIRCATPMANNLMLRRALYGSSGWVAIVNWVFVAGFVLWFLIGDVFIRLTSNIETAAMFGTVRPVILIALVLMMWATGSILTVACADMFNMKTRWKVIGAILPPLGNLWVAGNVRKTLEETKDERKGTFDGGKDWE
jgi:hypothetical protein